MRISASIIVFNEEENIAELCETISWCDEIVIVDSSSKDKTVEIAKLYTDKIFQREFKGYKDKHQFADSQTTGDWIFWIDADERVTPELRKSIEKLKKVEEKDLPDGFWIARKTRYLGRWIKYSGWYPDFQMRLYRKSASYWDGVAPHETARVKGRTEKLKGEFLHNTKKNLSEHHQVLDSYTSLAADYLTKKGKTIGGFGIFFNAFAAFIRTYFLKQGFRDGIPGLVIAMSTAYGVFLKYAKVWEKNHLNSNSIN
jgi:glycosyltransferase involved in cell wall biosynthesis